MATATAVWFRGPAELGLGSAELPAPSRDDLVVRTLASGISAGTEMLAYRGDLDPDLVLDEAIASLGGTFEYPFQYGYSCVGRVERSAAGVGAGSLVFAYHPHQDTFVAAAADVVVLDDGLDPRQATLFPLVETALQIALDSGPVLGEVVVVTGLGPVGLLSALLLRRAGAEVVAADPKAWRRDLATSLDLVAVAPEELGAAVHRLSPQAGTPLVVEASGNPDALGPALELLAHEGTALVASWYGTRAVVLPLGGSFHRRRLTIRSTQVSTIPAAAGSRWTRARRRDSVRSLLSQLPLDRLATHTYPFAQAAAAFADVDRGADGLVHAALSYEPAAL